MIKPNIFKWGGLIDSTIEDAIWTNDLSENGKILVAAASSTDGLTFGPMEPVTNGNDPFLPDGKYLKVKVLFERSTIDANGDGIKDSPLLYDLTVEAIPQNTPPDVTGAVADKDCLWPPNHKFETVTIIGVTDPDNDPIAITIDGVTSDEPTASDKGSGGEKFAPDAKGLGTDTAQIRAECSGKKDGRVYEISFTADDGRGGISRGTVLVKVPHDQSSGNQCPATDSGQQYDATAIN